MDFYQIMLERQDSIREIRRWLHRHPEVSYQEHATAGYIESLLDSWGIPHERVGETGVYGEIAGALGPGRTVALRADIDALPIAEENEADYRSEHAGRMHACGHDMHTACLLAAARELQARRDKFSGTVRLIFQQAEEVGGGVALFVQAGKMRGVDRVFGLHSAPDLKLGTVGIKAGPNNASVDVFRITVHGKAAHVSTPQLGADAILIASQIVMSLQALVARRTSPVDPVIVGVGKLQAGTVSNIIADTAVLEGTTRLFTPVLRQRVNGMVTRLAQETAALYGGSAEVEWEPHTSPLINPEEVCAELRPLVARLFGEKALIIDRALSCAGDNFADLQAEAHGAYAYVGVQSDELPGSEGPLHHSRYDIDERALPIGAALYAAAAWEWLV